MHVVKIANNNAESEAISMSIAIYILSITAMINRSKSSLLYRSNNILYLCEYTHGCMHALCDTCLLFFEKPKYFSGDQQPLRKPNTLPVLEGYRSTKKTLIAILGC